MTTQGFFSVCRWYLQNGGLFSIWSHKFRIHAQSRGWEKTEINISADLKEGEIPLFVANWMELAIIILSGTEKHVSHALMWELRNVDVNKEQWLPEFGDDT